MGQGRKTRMFTILIFLGVIVAFAFSYNTSVTKVVADAVYNDREILQDYNNEIIEKLIKEESVNDWSEIVEQYEDIVIVIENSHNKVITKSIGRTWSALDVKEQAPFEYHGEAYLIKSSVYFLRDYATDIRVLVRFIFIEFLIGISALSLLIFTVYSIMLRPYRELYRAIENYEKTGKLRKVALKGYAGEVYSRFVSMTENLEKQQENQRRIIASISHDIKTPLTSIMGYAEQLKKDTITPERRERYIDTVYGKSVEIQQLVGEFDEYLSFNMPQKLNKGIFTAEQIRQLMLKDYADELENIGVKLTIINLAGNIPVSIDAQKFKRVWGNLLSNSLKHLGDGEKIVRIEILSDKNKLYFNIHDSGEGVEEEKLDMIFEPLYTSDEGRKVAGLGLAICREIVDSHEGRIYAKKSELGGLAVCIELSRADRKSSGKNRKINTHLKEDENGTEKE